MKKYPKITVFTPTFNTVKTIERTINNVLAQNYPNLEYIVVDGASTDGTLEVLQKYSKHFTKLISEPDKGIYDAMNKGIRLATGDWIIFMNAQDQFYTNDTLIKLAAELTDEVDVLYGGYQFNHIYGVSEYRPPVPTTQFWKGMNICHQSIVTRTSLLKEHPYNLSYKIVADYEAVMHQLYVQKAKFKAVNYPIAILSGGGLSDKKRAQSLKEQIVVAEKFDSKFSHALWRRLNYWYRVFRIKVRDMLPRDIVTKYLSATRKGKNTDN